MSENTMKEAEETVVTTVETTVKTVEPENAEAESTGAEPEVKSTEQEVKSTEQEVKSVEPAVKNTDPGTKSAERSLETEDEPEPVIFADEEPSKKRFFRFNKQEEEHFSRDKWILSRISREDLMDYLRLEQSRMDKLQMAKERKWKRINTTIRLVASLAAGVVAIYFLKDEPTILVNILYICGILGGAWIWNSRKDKK